MKERDWLILAAVLLVLVVWLENGDSLFSSAEFACGIAIVTDDESGRSSQLAQAIRGDECKPALSRILSASWHGDRQE
jgi:hypothetical protein